MKDIDNKSDSSVEEDKIEINNPSFSMVKYKI